MFGFEGTRPWADCERDFVILKGATELRIALHHFGSAGTVSFGPVSLTVKRNRALCLGLTAKEVGEWSPVALPVAETNGCFATRIERLPPELDGLSNADRSWHGAMDFAGKIKYNITRKMNPGFVFA